MRKVGIMGGTFNPIHAGHLLLAEWARDTLDLDQVYFIPAGDPYLKDPGKILPAEERLHMTELAIQGNPSFQCLDLEVKRVGNTYTYETLLELRRSKPDTEFYFLCGADCLFSIENWKCPELIFQNCVLVASVRNNTSLTAMETKKQELSAKYHARIILLPFLNYSISSTEIRERVSDGRSIRYLVPDSVREYIVEKGFYRE